MKKGKWLVVDGKNPFFEFVNTPAGTALTRNIERKVKKAGGMYDINTNGLLKTKSTKEWGALPFAFEFRTHIFGGTSRGKRGTTRTLLHASTISKLAYEEKSMIYGHRMCSADPFRFANTLSVWFDTFVKFGITPSSSGESQQQPCGNNGTVPFAHHHQQHQHFENTGLLGQLIPTLLHQLQAQQQQWNAVLPILPAKRGAAGDDEGDEGNCGQEGNKKRRGAPRKPLDQLSSEHATRLVRDAMCSTMEARTTGVVHRGLETDDQTALRSVNKHNQLRVQVLFNDKSVRNEVVSCCTSGGGAQQSGGAAHKRSK